MPVYVPPGPKRWPPLPPPLVSKATSLARRPFVSPGVQETTELASPSVALTPRGAAGAVKTRTGAEGADGWLVPASFVAVTVNVTSSPVAANVKLALVPVAAAGAAPFEGVTV
jgi:hypothetical protein